MTKLAESSGTVVFEDGRKLYISKRPAQWISVFLFVTALLAIILLVNGVLQLTAFNNQIAGSSMIGIIFIGAGVVVAIIFLKVKAYQKKVNAIPLHELKSICIFDLERNMLLDNQQNVLAPANETYITRKMQISSSSPELRIQWNNGALSIAKGNPFSGGIAAIEKILLAKGIKRR